MQYDHRLVEKKWQKRWDDEGIFKAADNVKREKKRYILDMFPYPSGAGLHVGHPEGYTATDIYARYLRMNGYQVLHPMGWDAFGLPAENYAIKNGVHPAESTASNIKTFTRQIKSLGFSYDWSREVNTSAPEYYKWTQWLFLQLYKAGLAYKKAAPVNWCPSCQTVLANEQVVDGKCERCGTAVVQKNLEQWFFKITGESFELQVSSYKKKKKASYPERLLNNLESLDWPEPIKTVQRNWIGKSEGASIIFSLVEIPGQEDGKHSVEIFTTRPDTIFGATFMAISPELAQKWVEVGWQASAEVKDYTKKALAERAKNDKTAEPKKTGVFSGVYATNPANQEKIPVWVADYVLAGYGTGAVMAVPAHDERDFEFAKKFGLEIREVISTGESLPSIGVGKLINSGEFDGMDSEEAKWKITAKVGGKKTIQYKLRDWLISRQRYWGAPIPIIYCDDCGEQAVLEKDLPVELPTDVDFRPTGESPLQRSESFHKVKCPKCGKDARRESDTMDTFVDSSWYWLRYTDPKNEKEFASKDKINAWLPVDTYVGGAEHAVMHLMYARFIAMALRDLGYLEFEEPFLQLRNQGLILGPDGQKMSKSRGNVINPDEVVEKFGADTMRMYEMFMGPLEDAKPWDTNGMVGVRRFLDRVWEMPKLQMSKSKIQTNVKIQNPKSTVERELHKLIKKVGNDIETFNFNTAVSQMMIFVNAVYKVGEISQEYLEMFLKVLSPFAPHLANELWEKLGHKELMEKETWPKYDESLLQDEMVTYIVQINGKVRAQVGAAPDVNEKVIADLAKSDEKVSKYLEGKQIVKQIFVPAKLINFVIK
ncbi:MAG: leucine--tRNA ligase [Patescibacteria group bacterium]